jgi:hypothetical protein
MYAYLRRKHKTLFRENPGTIGSIMGFTPIGAFLISKPTADMRVK